jgi:4-hydroxy-tetrahydrodipicolinate synthase
METLKGTGVALVTPFKKDLSVDYTGLLALLEHTAKGVDYFVVQGTTGESATTQQGKKRKFYHSLIKTILTICPLCMVLAAITLLR